MDTAKTYLEHLNPAQREAAMVVDGPLMMYAGAGCGKTATVASRIAYMIDKGIDPASILLLTFTNKAAGEMKERVIRMAGDGGDKVTATTFHSFCALVLRKYAECVNVQNNFRILTEKDAEDALDICLTKYTDAKYGREVPKSFPKARQIQALFSYCVDFMVGVDDALKLSRFDVFAGYEDDAKAIVKQYNEYKRSRNILDYEDLLRLTYILLQCHENVRATLDRRYKYISCDEYQDTNNIQNEILNMLSQDYPNLAVVGDDNQSIYAFRGSNVQNIMEFEQTHPNCRVVKLVENYRSTQEILDFANAVMSHATEGIEKVLHGQRSGGPLPVIYHCNDTYSEADLILTQIRNIVANGGKYSDCAVLCRSGNGSAAVEGALNKNLIPFKKFGGKKFFEYECIRDALAFVKVLDSPRDEMSWFRIFQMYPGIGKSTAGKLTDVCSASGLDVVTQVPKMAKLAPYIRELQDNIGNLKNMPFNDAIQEITDKYYPSLRNRLITLSNMAPSAKRSELDKLQVFDRERLNVLLELSRNYKDTESFLDSFALDSNTTVDSGDFVTVSTVHSAKGLEYKHVFVLDCVEGSFPCVKPGADSSSVSEELRLFYVAITRAKESLYCYVPEYVNHQFTCESRFLDHENVEAVADQESEKRWESDFSLF